MHTRMHITAQAGKMEQKGVYTNIGALQAALPTLPYSSLTVQITDASV